jgi:hypothetical protein
VTRPVLSAYSFSLASSTLSSTVAFSSACSSSSWLSRRFVTGPVDIRSICSRDSPRDFRLLSLFLSRVRYLSLSLPLVLSPPETVSLSFPLLSLSLFRFMYYSMLIVTILRRRYLPPRLQWYQLLVAPLLTIPLTLS